MRKLTTALLGLFVLCFAAAPIALADSTSIQSVLFNVNGTPFTDYSAVGMNVGGFDQATGLGTITFTYNPGPGTYFFDVFLDHSLSVPFFNEYGTVNGAPTAGQSYEIGDSFASNIYNDVLAGGALPNTNTLPGTLSTFDGLCGGVTCNGDLAMAMGFAFTLGANQLELITLAVSHTNPGGFTLQGTHPGDAANPTASDIFFNGSAVTQPISVTPVPEPSSLILLLGSAPVALVFKKLRSKFSTT